MGKGTVKHLRNHGFYSTGFKYEELQGKELKVIVNPPLKPAQPDILSLSLSGIFSFSLKVQLISKLKGKS